MNRKRLIKIAAWILFGPLVVLFLYGWAMYLLWDSYSAASQARVAAVEIAFGLREYGSDFDRKKLEEAPESVRPFCDESIQHICYIVTDIAVDPCDPVFPFFPHRCVTLYASPTLLMDAEAFEKFQQAALYPCRFLPKPSPNNAWMREVQTWWRYARCETGGDGVKKIRLNTLINNRTFRAATPLERE